MKKNDEDTEDTARGERLQAARQAWSEKQGSAKDGSAGNVIVAMHDSVDRAGFVRTGYSATFNDLRKEEVEALLAAVYARVEAEDDFCEEELTKRSGSRLGKGGKVVGGDGKIKL